MQAMMGRNNCTCQGERSKAQLMETIGQSAFAAYDTRFGPLTMDLIDETDCHSWEWMMQPWPWERSGKGRC